MQNAVKHTCRTAPREQTGPGSGQQLWQPLQDSLRAPWTGAPGLLLPSPSAAVPRRRDEVAVPPGHLLLPSEHTARGFGSWLGSSSSACGARPRPAPGGVEHPLLLVRLRAWWHRLCPPDRVGWLIVGHCIASACPDLHCLSPWTMAMPYEALRSSGGAQQVVWPPAASPEAAGAPLPPRVA